MLNLEKYVESRKICRIQKNMLNLEKYVESRKYVKSRKIC